MMSCFTGYGLFATKDFEKGSFLVEYRGRVSGADDDLEDSDENYIFYYKVNGREMRYVCVLLSRKRTCSGCHFIICLKYVSLHFVEIMDHRISQSDASMNTNNT